MKRYERSALALVCALVLVLVVATLSRPPAQVTAAPKAILYLTASSASGEVGPPSLKPVPGLQALAQSMSRAKARKVYDSLRTLGYQLEAVMAGENMVPRLFLGSFPEDMANLREVKVKKALFIKTVLPLVLQVNEEILQDRLRLWKIRHAVRLGSRVKAEDRLWLRVKAEKYGLASDDIDGLLRRIDVIPPSLALAQAAEESGWGTSRFVREGNALFGQYAFSDVGTLEPRKRDDDKNHYIRSFPTLLDSVRSYAKNLNSHRAYRHFRETRSELRREGKPLDGKILAQTLKRYSARGEAYIKTLHVIMGVNDLQRADDLRLRAPGGVDYPMI